MDRRPPTLDELAALVQRLEQRLLNSPRMHIKDICLRYCISRSTFYRLRRRRKLPPPSLELNGPLWTLEDLERFEAGQRRREKRGRRLSGELSRV